MQLKPGMLLHVTLMALLVAIAVAATASTAVASYSSQGTALPTTAELTTNKDSLNDIVFDMPYDSWSTMYQGLKQSDQYDWMDWTPIIAQVPMWDGTTRSSMPASGMTSHGATWP